MFGKQENGEAALSYVIMGHGSVPSLTFNRVGWLVQFVLVVADIDMPPLSDHSSFLASLKHT